MKHVVKRSPRILHSSPVEEKKLGFPFSENGPSAIQVEGAMATFSDLRGWEERGVTTPIADRSWCGHGSKKKCGFRTMKLVHERGGHNRVVPMELFSLPPRCVMELDHNRTSWLRMRGGWISWGAPRHNTRWLKHLLKWWMNTTYHPFKLQIDEALCPNVEKFFSGFLLYRRQSRSK